MGNFDEEIKNRLKLKKFKKFKSFKIKIKKDLMYYLVELLFVEVSF